MPMDPFSSEKEIVQEDIEAVERCGLYGDEDGREYVKIDDSKPKLAKQRRRKPPIHIPALPILKNTDINFR
jgi:hypothetical protein